MPEITVVNVRGMSPNAPGIHYVGRASGGWKPSALANRHHIGSYCTRQQSVARFKSDLWKVIKAKNSPAWDELQSLVSSSEPLVLGCWCLPIRPCHAEVIRDAILYLRSQEKSAAQ